MNMLTNYAMRSMNQMTGGAANQGTVGQFFYVLFLALLVLFIKVFLVQWAYNETMPTMFNQRYRKITLMEALYLVILAQSLFN